jgi:phage regulator Rha-like protein
MLTMSSIDIAELVGKRHDNVKRTIQTLVERHVIRLPQFEEIENGQGQKVGLFNIEKRDTFVVVAQLSPEFTARLVDRWQELESQKAPALPSTYREALVALLASEDAKEQALLERDEAITTKAEIGNRREATAMNTASQAVKKVAALQAQLDTSAQFCTIKRMQMLKHGQPFDWRKLKHASAEMGIDAIDVFDQNYGTVKAYHEDVWLEVYGLRIEA